MVIKIATTMFVLRLLINSSWKWWK